MSRDTSKRRVKLLKAEEKVSHRYPKLRVLSQAFSLGTLVLVPLSGLARVDFWGDEHRLFFEPTSLKQALGGVIIGIAAMYVLTFLSNVVAGRLFCGWGCPVGQICRYGDAVERPKLTRWQWRWTHLQGGAYSGLFVLSVLAWWVDLRVFYLGSPVALLVMWPLLAFGVAGAFVHGRWWRWDFCKTVCPIGMYYSIMSPASYFGIHFRNQEETCIECNACDNICPVSLPPRELNLPITNRTGLSIMDAPGHNHCLECGDCIRVCEFMVGQAGKPSAPLRLGYFTGPQHQDRDTALDSKE